MKKDIIPPKVENIAVAIIPETNEFNEQIWNVYLLNLKNVPIEGVIISSKGYGNINNEPRSTSVLRHYVKNLPPNSFVKIEPIIEAVFALNNEYWVSYFINNTLYDKKYVFLAESISENFFTNVPLIEKKGVMII